MSDVDKSKNKQELKMFLDICVAKYICDLIDNRYESVVKDTYSLYELVMNQFLKNENKKFNFIQDDVIATSNIDGLYLKRNDATMKISKMALPLALDQYLDTVEYAEDRSGVFDLEYVEQIFKISNNYFSGGAEINIHKIRKRHELEDLYYEPLSATFIVDDIYFMFFKESNYSDFLLDFKLPDGKFLYNEFETIYKSFFIDHFQNANLSIRNFEGIINNGHEWERICDLVVEVSDKCGQMFKDQIYNIAIDFVKSSSFAEDLRSHLSASPLNEVFLPMDKNDYGVNFLLDLDGHKNSLADTIDKITWYWISSGKNIYTLSPNFKLYRNILKNRDWIKETCSYIKSNWSSLFEYSLYNTFLWYDFTYSSSSVFNYSMIYPYESIDNSSNAYFINGLNIFILVDMVLLLDPEVDRYDLQFLSNCVSEFKEDKLPVGVGINYVQYILLKNI